MRTYIILLFVAIMSLGTAFSQNDNGEAEAPAINDFVVAEKQPEPLNLDSVKTLIGYPKIASDSGISGSVILRILVGKDGSYIKHKVIKSAHPFLSMAVEEKIPAIRFSPAIQEEKAIPFWVNIPFNFKLTDLEAEELPAEIAIRSLSQKLQEDPNDYESLLKRGIEYKVLERYDEALEDFERSISVNPKKNKKKKNDYVMLFYAQLAKGKTYMALGKWGMAEQSLTEAINTGLVAKNPDTSLVSTLPNAYLERGLAYAKRNQTDLAHADYDWVLANDPDESCLVWSLKYDLSLSTEDYMGVVKALDAIIPCEAENSAQSLSLHFNRGYYRFRAEDYEGSIADYDYVLEKADNYMIKLAVYNQKAMTLAKMDRYEDAIASLQKSMDLNVLHPQAYFFKSKIQFEKGGMRKEACDNMRKAVTYGLDGEDLTEAETWMGDNCE